MKKENKSEKKLSLKKFQIAKINNLKNIVGGLEKTCAFPENASKAQQDGIGGGGK